MSNRSFLDELGLEGLAAVDLAEVSWPEHEVAEGRGLAGAALAAQVAFVSLGVPFDRIGGTLELLPRTHVVRYQPGVGISVVGTHWHGLAEAVVTDQENRVDMDLDRTEAVVELSDGRLLHFHRADRGVIVRELLLPVAPLMPVPPPPGDWLASIGDEWLGEAVREQLSVDDSWHNAVAVGLTLRLPPPEPGVDWRRITTASSWPHRWMASLPSEARETLRDLAVARVDGLWATLEDLREALDPEDADWRAAVVEWCRERDEIEGVRVLLNWAGHGSRLSAVLAPFDTEAERFARSIPVAFTVDDEHLRRASVTNPLSWWVRVERSSQMA